jgi:ketosteroid isomerase-like protein
MKSLRFLVPVVSMASAGCAPRVDTAAELEALRQADAQYAQAAGSMNVDAWLGLYAPNATLYAPNMAPITGTEAIRAFGTQMSSAAGFSAVFHPTAVEVGSGGDIGYTLSHYVVTMNGPDGKPVTEKGPDFHLWKKQADGSWKIVLDLWNSEDPLPAPAPAPAGRR